MGILILLTTAPSLFNVFDLRNPGALTSPWTTTSYNKILPDWWVGIYPLTYYFIGTYLKTQVDVKRIKTWKPLLLLIVSVLCFGGFNIWRSQTMSHVWGAWCDWASFENMVDATLIFLVINSIPFPEGKGIFGKAIGLCSELTFGAYLLSWIPDEYYYTRINDSIADMQTKFQLYSKTVSRVIVISLVLSLAVYAVVQLLFYAVRKLRHKTMG